MMMRSAFRQRVFETEIVVLGRVGMPGEADARAIADDLDELGTVRSVDGGVVGVEIAAQWNVHGGNDKPILRRLSQHRGDEGKLLRAAPPLILAAAQIVDII